VEDLTDAIFGIPSGIVVKPEITEDFIKGNYGKGFMVLSKTIYTKTNNKIHGQKASL